jgi:hypothetical protein
MDIGTALIMVLLVFASFDTVRERVRASRGSVPGHTTRSRPQRIIMIASAVTALCLALGGAFYIVFGHQLIESAYRGESFEFLNRLIRHDRLKVARDGYPRDLDHYFEMGRVLWSRLALACMTVALLVVGVLVRREAVAFLKAFFTKATHPVNLALFRIVLFWTPFEEVDVSSIVFFSQLPAELRFAPSGFGWLLNSFPLHEAWVRMAVNLYLVACVTGMLGLWSRTSALLVALLGFYVLGIPQLFGKVNHSHHFVWFPAVLAASRCGNALSCDAILAAWKRADRGVTAPPGPASDYTAPLRIVAILLGVIYFFPGFWKAWSGGVDWVLGENLRYQMYSKWLEFGDWVPVFRLDHYPLLYKFSALTTIAFELSFVALIFLPTLFVLAPLNGMLFHGMSTPSWGFSFTASFGPTWSCSTGTESSRGWGAGSTRPSYISSTTAAVGSAVERLPRCACSTCWSE